MSEHAKPVAGVDVHSQVPARLWTGTYILVCTAAFLAYANYALLTPTLPLFVDSLGGSSSIVGFALATFSTVSFLVRPFVGRLVDTWSARGIFGIGSFLVGVGSLGYLMPNLGAVFVGRAVQGIGWAGVNTGATTMVAALAPPHRRGEASGYFQTALMVAVAFLPATALWLLDISSFSFVFLLASLGALLSAALTSGIRGRQHATHSARSEGLLASLVERGAILPSSLLLLMNLSFPAAVFFVPLYARQLGIGNVALFFLVQGLANVLTQASLGRLSDRIGRPPTIVLGMVMTIGGLLLLSQATGPAVLVAGGAVYAFGTSLANPALMAMVMDRAQPGKFGAAMATYSLSFQVGNAVGALVGGLLIDWRGFQVLYLASVVPLVAGLAVTWVNRSGRLPRSSQR